MGGSPKQDSKSAQITSAVPLSSGRPITPVSSSYLHEVAEGEFVVENVSQVNWAAGQYRHLVLAVELAVCERLVVSAHTHARCHTHTHARTYARAHMHTHTCTHAHTHTQAHTHTGTHTHTHTHTHTPLSKSLLTDHLYLFCSQWGAYLESAGVTGSQRTKGGWSDHRC